MRTMLVSWLWCSHLAFSVEENRQDGGVHDDSSSIPYSPYQLPHVVHNNPFGIFGYPALLQEV